MIKRESSSTGEDAGNGKKRHYKLWFLAAIIMVALWSMFTGSVILKWSEGNHSLIHEDLDVLEVEEREKVVRHMWDGMSTLTDTFHYLSFGRKLFKRLTTTWSVMFLPFQKLPKCHCSLSIYSRASGDQEK